MESMGAVAGTANVNIDFHDAFNTLGIRVEDRSKWLETVIKVRAVLGHNRIRAVEVLANSRVGKFNLLKNKIKYEIFYTFKNGCCNYLCVLFDVKFNSDF